MKNILVKLKETPVKIMPGSWSWYPVSAPIDLKDLILATSKRALGEFIGSVQTEEEALSGV